MLIIRLNENEMNEMKIIQYAWTGGVW